MYARIIIDQFTINERSLCKKRSTFKVSASFNCMDPCYLTDECRIFVAMVTVQHFPQALVGCYEAEFCAIILMDFIRQGEYEIVTQGRIAFMLKSLNVFQVPTNLLNVELHLPKRRENNREFQLTGGFLDVDKTWIIKLVSDFEDNLIFSFWNYLFFLLWRIFERFHPWYKHIMAKMPSEKSLFFFFFHFSPYQYLCFTHTCINNLAKMNY